MIVTATYSDFSIQAPCDVAVALFGAGRYRLLKNAEQRHHLAQAWMAELLRVNHT